MIEIDTVYFYSIVTRILMVFVMFEAFLTGDFFVDSVRQHHPCGLSHFPKANRVGLPVARERHRREHLRDPRRKWLRDGYDMV